MIGAFLVGWMLVIPPSYPGYAVSVSGPYRTEEDCKAVFIELNSIVARKEALEWGVFRGEGQEKNYTPDVGLGEHGRYTPLPTLPGAPELTEVNGQKAGTVKALLMAENADDLRCAQWVITQGAAKRGEGDE